MVTSLLMMVLGLAVLIKGADFFIHASVSVGRFLNLPSFVIGVILVGFGTSLPELVSSVLAVHAGSSEIVIGNVLGSNITNILLVLGVVGLIGGVFFVKTDLLKFDLPVLTGGAFILALMVRDGVFTTGEGVVCLVMLAIYLTAMVVSEDGVRENPPAANKPTVVTWLMLAASPVAIFLVRNSRSTLSSRSPRFSTSARRSLRSLPWHSAPRCRRSSLPSVRLAAANRR